MLYLTVIIYLIYSVTTESTYQCKTKDLSWTEFETCIQNATDQIDLYISQSDSTKDGSFQSLTNAFLNNKLTILNLSVNLQGSTVFSEQMKYMVNFLAIFKNVQTLSFYIDHDYQENAVLQFTSFYGITDRFNQNKLKNLNLYFNTGIEYFPVLYEVYSENVNVKITLDVSKYDKKPAYEDYLNILVRKTLNLEGNILKFVYLELIFDKNQRFNEFFSDIQPMFDSIKVEFKQFHFGVTNVDSTDRVKQVLHKLKANHLDLVVNNCSSGNIKQEDFYFTNVKNLNLNVSGYNIKNGQWVMLLVSLYKQDLNKQSIEVLVQNTQIQELQFKKFFNNRAYDNLELDVVVSFSNNKSLKSIDMYQFITDSIFGSFAIFFNNTNVVDFVASPMIQDSQLGNFKFHFDNSEFEDLHQLPFLSLFEGEVKIKNFLFSTHTTSCQQFTDINTLPIFSQFTMIPLQTDEKRTIQFALTQNKTDELSDQLHLNTYLNKLIHQVLNGISQLPQESQGSFDIIFSYHNSDEQYTYTLQPGQQASNLPIFNADGELIDINQYHIMNDGLQCLQTNNQNSCLLCNTTDICQQCDNGYVLGNHIKECFDVKQQQKEQVCISLLNQLYDNGLNATIPITFNETSAFFDFYVNSDIVLDTECVDLYAQYQNKDNDTQLLKLKIDTDAQFFRAAFNLQQLENHGCKYVKERTTYKCQGDIVILYQGSLKMQFGYYFDIIINSQNKNVYSVDNNHIVNTKTFESPDIAQLGLNIRICTKENTNCAWIDELEEPFKIYNKEHFLFKILLYNSIFKFKLKLKLQDIKIDGKSQNIVSQNFDDIYYELDGTTEVSLEAKQGISSIIFVVSLHPIPNTPSNRRSLEEDLSQLLNQNKVTHQQNIVVQVRGEEEEQNKEPKIVKQKYFLANIILGTVFLVLFGYNVVLFIKYRALPKQGFKQSATESKSSEEDNTNQIQVSPS